MKVKNIKFVKPNKQNNETKTTTCIAGFVCRHRAGGKKK
jgi:hypothetical protein